jgi:hypothetical protein
MLPLALEEKIDRSIQASDLKTLGKSRREEDSDLVRGMVRINSVGMKGGLLYLSNTITRIGVVVGASWRRRSSAATIARALHMSV